MVHVVLAGGAGNVGREIVQELIDQGKHQVTVFSRSSRPDLSADGIEVVTTNYLDKDELTTALKGVHTVFSFVTNDPGNTCQMNLIAACIAAGVKRFAPSEWGAISNSGMPSYAYKDVIHEHLRQINAKKTVLEYCLFQTGSIMNFMIYPHKSARFLHVGCVGIDVEEGRAAMVENGDDYRVYTTIQDIAKVVVAAIDYEDPWPERGGMVGSRIQVKDLIKLLEKYTGRQFTIYALKKADLEKGQYLSDWIPPMSHPNVPPAMMTPEVKCRILAPYELMGSNGGTDVSPDWNRLLPEYKFTNIEDFLGQNLTGK